jgi:hypothetical protein
MFDNLWKKWVDIKANDPVKARGIRIAFIAAVLLVPFITGWGIGGIDLGLRVVAFLVGGALGLTILAVLANMFLGSVAHYIYFGTFEGDKTVIEVHDAYQILKNKKNKSQNYSSPTIVKTMGLDPGPTENQYDQGPDWMQNK